MTHAPAAFSHPDPVVELLRLVPTTSPQMCRERLGELLATCAMEHRQGLSRCEPLIHWHDEANQGRFGSGLGRAIEAVAWFRASAYRGAAAWVISAVGFGAGMAGNPGLGLRWVSDALAEAGETVDLQVLVRLWATKGGLLQMMGDLEEASSAFERAIGISAGLADTGYRISALNNHAFSLLCRALPMVGRSESRDGFALRALGLAQEALSAIQQGQGGARFRAWKPERWRAWCLSNQGAALELLGRLDEAADCFDAGLPLAAVNLRIQVVMEAHHARVLAATGRLDQARTLLESALERAPIDLMDDCREAIILSGIAVESQHGQADRALRWAQRRAMRLEARMQAGQAAVREHLRIESDLRRQMDEERQALRAELRRSKARERLLQTDADTVRQGGAAPPLARHDRRSELTRREAQVLILLSQGHSYKAASVTMGVELSTLQSYVRSMYRKLQVHSRHQAIIKARELRVI